MSTDMSTNMSENLSDKKQAISEFFQQLSAPHVRDLVPYESARRLFSGGQYWLNANESPYANDYHINASHFNRYPECQPQDVIDNYAAYTGVNAENVLVSRGADEGIELLIRAFCEPGNDSITICPPTYGMYAISANTFNVQVCKAPSNADFSLDLPALKNLAEQAQPPKLVFICSPNNPTGNRIAEAQLSEVLAMFAGKSLVVVDEAYIEFGTLETNTDSRTSSWASKLNDYPHLVVLRTLSKAFALAGLRCGFVLAAPEIIRILLKVIAPYPLPEPVAQIAAQALSPQGIERMQSQVATLQSAQQQLLTACSALPGWQHVGNCTANFILFRVPEKQAVMDYLVANGMLIRDQSKQVQLQDCLRISIGSETENNVLLALLRDFYR